MRGVRLAVLISGRGSNLEAIAEACDSHFLRAKIVLVVANRADAAGLGLAEERGLECALVDDRLGDKNRQDEEILKLFHRYRVQLVVLAGFMRILGTRLVEAFSDRIVNIHPSLLPKFKGLTTHERVIQAGEKWHGFSIHMVSAELDSGFVLLQCPIGVKPDDTPESLANRLLAQENHWYPRLLRLIVDGQLLLKEGEGYFLGRKLEAGGLKVLPALL